MKLLGTCILLLAVMAVYSQSSIDLLTLSYRNGPAQPYVSGSGEASETVFMGNMKIPVVFNESTIWYSDLTYQYSYVNYTVNVQGAIMPIALHGFILQTGLVKKINDKNAVQLLFVPRLMSDLNQVSTQHLQLGGIGLYEIKYTDQLTMRYGMMYNKEKFGNMFVPLIYLDWKMGPKWSITGMLPIFAKVNYHISEKFTLGFSHFGLITSYQTGNATYNSDYIERKSIDLTLFGRYKIWNNLCLEGRAGMAIARSYLQFGEGDEMDFRVAILSFGDNRTQKNVAFDSGPIFDIRLVYNLLLPE